MLLVTWSSCTGAISIECDQKEWCVEYDKWADIVKNRGLGVVMDYNHISPALLISVACDEC